MTIANLPNRAIIQIAGAEAEAFLDNLITCKVVDLDIGQARFGALLTPQGKIMFDFFLLQTTHGFWLDTPANMADDLLKRLMFYRLRAKVDLSKIGLVKVSAAFDTEKPGGALAIVDPRHPNLGWRLYGDVNGMDDPETYTRLLISCCVPEGGTDFQYGDAYPHEVLMDQSGGVDFKKGCYVGQEVISRMQHRGTAKKRVIHITAETDLPESGTEILADGKPAGTVGSTSGMHGLALVRLDRIHEAAKVEADGIALTASLPDWVNFSWPEPR